MINAVVTAETEAATHRPCHHLSVHGQTHILYYLCTSQTRDIRYRKTASIYMYQLHSSRAPNPTLFQGQQVATNKKNLSFLHHQLTVDNLRVSLDRFRHQHRLIFQHLLQFLHKFDSLPEGFRFIRNIFRFDQGHLCAFKLFAARTTKMFVLPGLTYPNTHSIDYFKFHFISNIIHCSTTLYLADSGLKARSIGSFA